MSRGHAARFAEVRHAENIGGTLKRIWTYCAREKLMLISVLSIGILFRRLRHGSKAIRTSAKKGGEAS